MLPEDGYFLGPEARSDSDNALSAAHWAAVDESVRALAEDLWFSPEEWVLFRTLFTIVLDRDAWVHTGRVPTTLGGLGTELRHGVDLARLYSDSLYARARLMARCAYQAAAATAEVKAGEATSELR